MFKLIETRIRELALEAMPGPEKMDQLVGEIVGSIVAGADALLDLPQPAEGASDLVLKAIRPVLERHARNLAQGMYDRIHNELHGERVNAAAAKRADLGTQNISLAEMESSGIALARGIDNRVAPEHHAAIQYTAESLQVVRNAVGPVRMSSFYRVRELQAAIYEEVIAELAKRGAVGQRKIAKIFKSQHMQGEAADIHGFLPRKKLLAALIRLHEEGKLPGLDQVIQYDWGSALKQKMLHVSFVDPEVGKPRAKFLRSPAQGEYVKL